jgi:multiple sugar transport system ATP-binding protein
MSLAAASDAHPQALVQTVERLGAETVLTATLDAGGDVALRAPSDLRVEPGERVGLRLSPAEIHLFDPDTGAALPRRPTH